MFDTSIITYVVSTVPDFVHVNIQRSDNIRCSPGGVEKRNSHGTGPMLVADSGGHSPHCVGMAR